MKANNRIAQLLGPFDQVLTPLGTTLFCLLGWAVLAPFSSSLLGMGLCWWGIGLLLITIQLERPWLSVLPFPPLTVLMLHLVLRWVLGGMLLLISQSGTADVQIWVDNVASALPLNAAMSSALILVGCVWNWKIIRQYPTPLSAPPAQNTPGHFSRSNLMTLALITGVIAIGYTFVGFFSGTLDRGSSYLDWAGKLWKPDTLFSAFIKLRDLYFIILPWLLWEWRNKKWVCIAFGSATISSLILSMSLGGRGLILYPALLLIGGLWMAGCSTKVMRWLISFVLIGSIAITILLPITRNQAIFQSSGMMDLGARWTALKQSFPEIAKPESLSLLGRDLYAWSDPYLFREPGLSQPPAGNKRLDNLFYLWIPKLFKPNRPEINDGHLIAKEIIGAPTAGMHEGRHIWFPGVSLAADLYWRFRWPGVILGSLIFAILFNAFARLWYRFASLKRGTASMLIALYPTTFLQGPPLRSISETAWNWGYELPKYAIILFFIYLIVNYLNRHDTTSQH